MARVQVYLPDELHAALKQRGLSASRLLQAAIEGEVRRDELLAKVDRYLEAMDETYGPSTVREVAAAEAWADEIATAVTAARGASGAGGPGQAAS